MKKDVFVDNLKSICEPIVVDLGYELYYIEYVKENNEYYLRLYIDQEEGISLDDCEKVSRRISDMLDEKDPIKDFYYLEVQSPGLNRPIFTEDHMKRYVNREVMVRFDKAVNGAKNVKGILLEVNEDDIKVENNNNTFVVPRERIKSMNIEGEL